VKYGSKYASLKEDDPYTETLERAREVIRLKKEADANRLIQDFPEEGIQVLNGRYGPYITDKKKNAKIPKDRDPRSLTLEECRTMLGGARARALRPVGSRQARGGRYGCWRSGSRHRGSGCSSGSSSGRSSGRSRGAAARGGRRVSLSLSLRRPWRAGCLRCVVGRAAQGRRHDEESLTAARGQPIGGGQSAARRRCPREAQSICARRAQAAPSRESGDEKECGRKGACKNLRRCPGPGAWSEVEASWADS
jgi:hypothetical protein